MEDAGVVWKAIDETEHVIKCNVCGFQWSKMEEKREVIMDMAGRHWERMHRWSWKGEGNKDG